MALSKAFKTAMQQRCGYVSDDNLFKLTISNDCSTVCHSYDFMTQTVSIISGKGMTVIFFKDFPRDVLENVRDYMIDQGKQPLPLPQAEQPSNMNFTKDFTSGIK